MSTPFTSCLEDAPTKHLETWKNERIHAYAHKFVSRCFVPSLYVHEFVGMSPSQPNMMNTMAIDWLL